MASNFACDYQACEDIMKNHILKPLLISYLHKLEERAEKNVKKHGDNTIRDKKYYWEKKVVEPLTKLQIENKKFDLDIDKVNNLPYNIEYFEYLMLLKVVTENWASTKDDKLSIVKLYKKNIGKYELDKTFEELKTARDDFKGHDPVGDENNQYDDQNRIPGIFTRMRKLCKYLPYQEIDELVDGMGRLFSMMRFIETVRNGEIDCAWKEEQFMEMDYFSKVKGKYTHDAIDPVVRERILKAGPEIINQQVIDLVTAKKICDEAEAYYYGGKGRVQNLKAAYDRFEKAANLGFCRAKTWLYSLYLDGRGDYIKENKELALKYLEEAAKEDPEAQGILGTYKYADKKFEEAFKLYKVAAEYTGTEYMPNYSAQYNYGMCLFRGEGCEENKREGLNWIEKAAEGRDGDEVFESGGDKDAQLILAECFENGDVKKIRCTKSTPKKDRELANKWYLRSLESGDKDPKACFKVGMYYYDVDGGNDEERGIRYIQMGIDAYNLKKNNAKGSTLEPKHQ